MSNFLEFFTVHYVMGSLMGYLREPVADKGSNYFVKGKTDTDKASKRKWKRNITNNICLPYTKASSFPYKLTLGGRLRSSMQTGKATKVVFLVLWAYQFGISDNRSPATKLFYDFFATIISMCIIGYCNQKLLTLKKTHVCLDHITYVN